MIHASRRGRVASLATCLVATVLVAACGEDRTNGAACPVLCPLDQVAVRDTTFDAVVLDTVLAGVVTLGTEPALLLAHRGDTLDTRVVLRFDSLYSTVPRQGGDSAITEIDSAFLRLVVNFSDSRVTAPVRIDLYDVDTTAADTNTTAVLALYRPERILGGGTFDSSAVKDTLRVTLDKAKLLDKIKAKARLRLGLRLTSPVGAYISLGASDASQAAVVSYDPAPADTAIKPYLVGLRSRTPEEQDRLQFDLVDYVIVRTAPARPAGTFLSVGGLPSRRSFLRFDVPSRLLDSARILRATLLLTQFPNRGLDAADSVLVLPQLVLAGQEVTDLARAAALLSLFPVDTVRVAPGDSGVRALEMVSAVSQWSAVFNPFRQQQAIVLRSTVEGTRPFEAFFFSSEAGPALRPRLRISYSLRTNFGIP